MLARLLISYARPGDAEIVAALVAKSSLDASSCHFIVYEKFKKSALILSGFWHGVCINSQRDQG